MLADGKVVAAKNVSPDDEFIDSQTGRSVEILSITREMTTSDVYNFDTDSDNKLNHIVVAEGVLVGDITWQNSLASELGAVHIRN